MPVSHVRGPLTVAGAPLDDWQGRREPGVLEVRGRPRTQPVCNAGSPRKRGEQRGAFPWGAHQRDPANAKRLWTRED
jgi:hypothetical protein